MYTAITSIILCFIIGVTKSEWAFPGDFKFGVATSAYQIEGGWNADGKGINVWDHMTHSNPGFIKDGSNGDVACDSYHKWEEDIVMLKNLGVNHYRFSISWTRVLPNGFTSVINQAGVDYYNNLISKLLENGIEPVVTLFHWDSPQIFTPLGSFYSSTWPDFFGEYARVAFRLFGDRVKTWVTFNEPKVLCQDYSELMGGIHQVYPNGIIEYLCTHHVIKAHAEAYHIYNNEFRNKQKGKVGITLNFEWSEPASDAPEDAEAAEQRRQFEFGLYANPIVYGDYPKIVIDRIEDRSNKEGFPKSRLPKFSFSEKWKIVGSYDFLGLNHYNTWLVKAAEEAPIGKPSYNTDMGTEKFLKSSWKDNGWGGKVVPWGLQHTLRWLKKTYRNPKIFITECGYPNQSRALEDDDRIDYLKGYMNATLAAIYQDQVRVKMFTVWSLMDNFEWGQGYTIKFGLYDVDFASPNRTRTPRKSANYLKNVIETRRV